MPRLLKASDVAEILNLSSVDRVYALAREDILRVVRIGRQIRFCPDALDEFIREGGKALPGGWRRDA